MSAGAVAADDTYLRYVRPSHRWLLLGAGAVMVLLAAVALARDLRGVRVSGGHDHPAAERHAPWLLPLPVLVIALVAPPALGADSVVRAGSCGAVHRDADVFGPLSPGDAPEVAVGEFLQISCCATQPHPARRRRRPGCAASSRTPGYASAGWSSRGAARLRSTTCRR